MHSAYKHLCSVYGKCSAVIGLHGAYSAVLLSLVFSEVTHLMRMSPLCISVVLNMFCHYLLLIFLFFLFFFVCKSRANCSLKIRAHYYYCYYRSWEDRLDIELLIHT